MTDRPRVPTVLLLIGLLLLIPSGELLAYSGEDFVTALRTKFRTTSNIYLEATSRRTVPGMSPEKTPEVDTAYIVLAYEYPRQYLQLVAGTSNKRQHLLVKNDSMAIGYPHLDYSKTRSIDRSESRKLLMQNVPLAGALLGISSGEVPGESISVDSTADTIHVTVTRFRQNLPFKRVEAEFTRENLTPVYFQLEGERNFRVDVVKYVEEQRFPKWVENALSQFDLRWMEEAPV